MSFLLTKRCSPKKEGGFVLLITLLIVLLLVVIIFEIDFQSRADLRAAGNFRDDLGAYYVALSGITAEKAILQDDFRNAPASDHLGELWAATAPPFPVGEGHVSGKITDEAGKFNLNSLLEGTPVQINLQQGQLGRLFQLLSVDPNLVEPILDWIDQDNNARSNGAEDETYQTLPSPYPTKNGYLSTLEEILYIKGITPEIYHKISPYLTVSTTRLININTADPLIIQSLHDSTIGESELKDLLRGRPYSQSNVFWNNLPPSARGQYASDGFAVTSNIFSIVAHGTVHNTRKTIHAIWNRTQQNGYLYFKVE